MDPMYLLRDAEYREMSFSSLPELERSLRTLVNQLSRIRLVDAEGKAYFLNLEVSLVRDSENDEESGVYGVAH